LTSKEEEKKVFFSYFQCLLIIHYEDRRLW